MIVEKLFILALTSDFSSEFDMINSSVAGLDYKYALKLGRDNVRSIPLHIDQDPSSSSNWAESMKKDREQDIDAIKKACAKSSDIGVYLDAQGRGQRYVTDKISRCLDPLNFALLFKELGFTKMRKLCIVSCGWDVNWGSKFCLNLHDKAGLTPMITGWDCAITVYHPDKEAINSSAKYYAGSKPGDRKPISGLPEDEKSDMIGRKVSKGVSTGWSKNHQFPVSLDEDQGAAIRAQHKWFVQYVADKVEIIDPGKWTDKKTK
jgi:hypothetical protein